MTASDVPNLIKHNLRNAALNGFEGELRGQSAEHIVLDMINCGALDANHSKEALPLVQAWLAAP